MEGIILKAIDYKESSKIIYLLTEKGKKSVLVRGAKKIKSPFRILTSPLTIIDFEGTKNGFSTMIDASIIDYLEPLKKDFTLNKLANEMCSLVYYLCEDCDYSKLYAMLKKGLQCLDKYSLVYEAFALKFLFFLGINPNFKTCEICGTDKKIKGFSIDKGSVLCEEHSKSGDIDLDNTILLRNLYYNSFEENMEIDSNKVLMINAFIDEYYIKHANYRKK